MPIAFSAVKQDGASAITYCGFWWCFVEPSGLRYCYIGRSLRLGEAVHILVRKDVSLLCLKNLQTFVKKLWKRYNMLVHSITKLLRMLRRDSSRMPLLVIGCRNPASSWYNYMSYGRPWWEGKDFSSRLVRYPWTKLIMGSLLASMQDRENALTLTPTLFVRLSSVWPMLICTPQGWIANRSVFIGIKIP